MLGHRTVLAGHVKAINDAVSELSSWSEWSPVITPGAGGVPIGEIRTE